MGSKIYRGVLIVNVTAMLLQAVLAGRLLGGDTRSVLLHERTAKFLVLLALAQLMLAVYLRMRRIFLAGFRSPVQACCWQKRSSLQRAICTGWLFMFRSASQSSAACCGNCYGQQAHRPIAPLCRCRNERRGFSPSG
jgi:hypothetical protein